MHNLSLPNASISTPAKLNMGADKLHVVTVVFNPIRWKSRWSHYIDFEAHMLESGVNLTTVECALGQREFILDNPNVNHVKVRSYTVCFNKENLINLGIMSIAHDAKWIAWIDADVMFRDPNWADETVQALQQYDIIQPWSDVYLTGPGGRHHHVAHFRSFCLGYWSGQQVWSGGPNWWTKDGGYHEYFHSGFAWAARRSALEDLGGPLIETGVVGSGDNHMALALIGKAEKSYPQQMPEGYKQPILAWQQRALRHINLNIGFTYGTIEHLWHGRGVDRKYWDRWEIFIKNKFDPHFDLKKNTYGVIELAGNKPQLTHDVDRYLRERHEDGNII